MDSETKRIKNDLVNPQQNSGQTPQISQQNNIPQQQPIIFYQNLQFPQQSGVQQNPQPQYIINQSMIYQQPYGQPVIINPNQPGIIVNNQILPQITPIKWTIYPRLVICPFCMKNIKTRVEEEFNYTLCCLCSIFIPLICFAVIASGAGCACGGCGCSDKAQEEKDVTEVREPRDKCCLISGCYDGNHYCPECGNFLGKYKANC